LTYSLLYQREGRKKREWVGIFGDNFPKAKQPPDIGGLLIAFFCFACKPGVDQKKINDHLLNKSFRETRS